jgi:hypothetical protein
MNPLRPLVLAIVLGLSGCSSLPKVKTDIQALLDAALPVGFTGNAEVKHANPYFDFDFKFVGLEHGANGWTWKSFTYSRHDMFHTSGEITMGPAP